MLHPGSRRGQPRRLAHATRPAALAAVALAAVILTGCTAVGGGTAGGNAPGAPNASGSTKAPGRTAPGPVLPGRAYPGRAQPGLQGLVTSSGWEVTTYVTAVERYYHGPTRQLSGCPTIACDRATPRVDLGTYPRAFLRRVKGEGTGLITAGPHAGMYLNWSAGLGHGGFWLDTAPRDSYGGALVPFVSAAATLPRGTAVRLVTCGANTDGSAPDPQTCARLRSASWQITDQFTPGLGGPRHIDLYIGQETGPRFEATSPLWITFEGAVLAY